MATHDYNIANGSGAAVRSDINAALLAISSNNSEANPGPTTTFGYQFWADTTSEKMYIRNGDNTAWIELFDLDGTSLPSSSATEVVFNDAGADLDFRVEGDTEANLFFIDAGNDRVGIGTNAPTYNLDVESSGDTVIRARSSTTANPSFLLSEDNNTKWKIESVNNSDNRLRIIDQSGDEVVTVEQGGNVGIGQTNPTKKLDVYEGSTSNVEQYLRNTTVNLLSKIDGTTAAQFGTETSHPLLFLTSNSERARLDTSGRLIVGHSDNSGLASGGGLESLNGSGNNFAGTRYVNTSGGPDIWLGKSRSGTVGSFGLAQENDSLGTYGWYGSSDSAWRYAGQIRASVAAGFDNSDSYCPCYMHFYTSPGGTTAPTERMRITQSGRLKVTTQGSYISATDSSHELLNDAANVVHTVLRASATNYHGEGVHIRVNRPATSSYWFLGCVSSDTSDNEFILKGDGNAYADGSWSGGGADYAEYFEWSDGNTAEEDRRGISVVLDGDKIREAVSGEEPIGVISGNPSVVGDADIERWKGKYLRDDFGTYIQEDYEVEDEDGNTVTQQRRKLNPDYDPDVKYISRQDRPEWDCVGLMGKLRIRKGQVTGSRWIKMRDISGTVEEWLVR